MHESTRSRALVGVLCVFTLPFIVAVPAQGQSAEAVSAAYSLGGAREPGVRTYEIETRMTQYALTGERTPLNVLRLRVRCEVGRDGDDERQTCTALEYTMRRGESEPVTIPAIAGWTYRPGEGDELLGIEHARFEGLVDSEGTALPPDQTFYVYNSFIDLHMFDQVFARPSGEPGIQDLRRVGDGIVHYSANSEAPVHLGRIVAEGSTFRNGEITLRFKGLGRIEDRPTALIGYDSGASDFRMILEPMPDFRVTTTGSSHYQGDFHVDLETHWLAYATLHEFVVSETELPVPPGKVNTVVEREIVVRRVE